jgi:hypothetical protein
MQKNIKSDDSPHWSPGNRQLMNQNSVARENSSWSRHQALVEPKVKGAPWLLTVFRALALCLMFDTGCTPLQQYKVANVTTDIHDSSSSILRVETPAQNYVFSTIEFDDQGELWDSQQKSLTVDQICNLKTNGNPVTLVVFVHGWNNDASGSTPNFADFRRFIDAFSQTFSDSNSQRMTNGLKPRVVVGAYLAWRGRSATVLPFATFWGRKNTAARVAGVDCTDTIVSLIAATRFFGNHGADESKAIIIGHSFGGLIVEQALTKAMLGGMLLSPPADATTRGIIEAAKHNVDEAVGKRDSLIQITNELTWCIVTNKEQFITSQTEQVRSLYDQAANKLNSCMTNTMQWDGEQEIEDLIAEQNALNVRAIQSDWDQILGTRIKHFSGDSKLYENSYLYNLAKGIATNSLSVDNYFDNKTNIDWEAINRDLRSLSKTNDYSQALGTLLGIADRQYRHFIDHASTNLPEAAKDNNRLFLTEYWALSQFTNAPVINAARLYDQMKTAENNVNDTIEKAAAYYGSATRRFENAKAQMVWANRAVDDAQASFQSMVDPDRPPADLILLINPAAEALTAKSMVRALEENRFIQLKNRVNNPARPWIISVSSRGGWRGLPGDLGLSKAKTGDSLTDKIFPIGRNLSSTFKKFRYYTNNIGLDFAPGVTEIERPSADPNTEVLNQTNTVNTNLSRQMLRSFRYGGKRSQGVAAADVPYHKPDQLDYFLHTAPQLSQMWNRSVVTSVYTTNMVSGYSNNPLFCETNFAKLIRANISGSFTGTNAHAFFTTNAVNTIFDLQPKVSQINKSSYWIFSVDKSIIPEHGDIFKPNLVALTAALYRMSQANPYPTGTNASQPGAFSK